MISNSSTQSDLSSWSSVKSLDALSNGADASVKNKSTTTNATTDPDAGAVGTQTRLKSEFLPFQPMPSEKKLDTVTRLHGKCPAFRPMAADTRFDAITNAVYFALVSCG